MLVVMRFYFARTARRHKISKPHALAAIANAGAPTVANGCLNWIGMDDRGVELHIKGRPSIEDPENLVIIFHVMPTDLR